MNFKRNLNINSILKRKSLFLLGPRQTGKSTFLKQYIEKSNETSIFSISLLKAKDYIRYKSNPILFGEEIEYCIVKENKKIIIVDEIQKIPELLNEIHDLIESHKDVRFILTGSSARKLKRSDINLLGGRASRIYFHPINASEMGYENFEKNLIQYLNYGTLPSILTSADQWRDLQDYVILYLKEEVEQEAMIRSIGGFSKFLSRVAMTNSELINFTSLASDLQLSPKLVKEYYQILEDTLIGFLLPAYTQTKIRKAHSSAKFYLFDTGVTNALLDRRYVSEKTPEFGKLFEQKILCELKTFLDYHQMENRIFYWRSLSKIEVDILIKDKNDEWIGIEIKSNSTVTQKDAKGLLTLEEDLTLKRKIIVARVPRSRILENKIEVLSIKDFLSDLWEGRLIKT